MRNDEPSLRSRLEVGGRRLVVVATALIGLGFLARAMHEPLVAGSVGPTMYVFVVQPRSDQARVRNALVGHVTASMGIYCSNGPADALEQIVSYADAALYAAKEQGRNRAVLYQPFMREAA